MATGGLSSTVYKGSLFKQPGKSDKSADQALADAAMELLNVSRGTRKGYFNQLLQVLQGQIPEARIPDIQYAQEGALMKGGEERIATENALAAGGLSRTPYGTGARADASLVANQRAGTTAVDFLNSLFLQAPNAVLGQAQETGLQGLGTMADISATIQAARNASRASAVGGAAQGAGQLAALGILPQKAGGAGWLGFGANA